MNKKPSHNIIPTQGGVFRDFTLRVKLILRLIGDRRVSPWLKLLPIGGIIYLISPIDILSDIALPVIGELDDIAILWLTNYFFIELCPTDIVREHVRQLTTSNNSIIDDERNKAQQGEVVDGEVTDVPERK